MENRPNRIIWHHSADASTVSQTVKINEYHKSLNFPRSTLGYYGGYHYLIEKDGSVFQYRQNYEIGAHDKDENVNSIGICLAGNFNIELPTKAQEIAIADLIEKIKTRYNIFFGRIEPHRWGDSTDCPGRKLDDHWAEMVFLKYKINRLQRLLLWLSKKLLI
mgnify:CR=1 FL=1